MRPLTIGRKNWIRVGSAQAGQKVAAILSMVDAAIKTFSIRDYLAVRFFPDSLIARSSAYQTLPPQPWVVQCLQTETTGLLTILRHPGDYPFHRERRPLVFRLRFSGAPYGHRRARQRRPQTRPVVNLESSKVEQ